LDLVKYLVEHDMPVFERTNDDWTPFLLATVNDNISIMEYLLSKGVDIKKEHRKVKMVFLDQLLFIWPL